jgi:hypothetical protein
MTPRLKLPLVAALVCALLLALAPASSHAKRGMEVAVFDDSVLLFQLPRMAHRKKGLALAGQLHATWIRSNVIWSYVNHKQRKKKNKPKKIDYNWTGYDKLLNEAASKRIRVQLVLTGPAPAWATGNKKVGVYKPKASAFKDFAKAAAQHFAGHQQRYSIWNEPGHRAWLSPVNRSPSLYRSLYTTAYRTIKTYDPGAQVFIGETSPFQLGKKGKNAWAPLKWLRSVACAKSNYKRARKCATLLTDGYAHHPYDFAHKPTYKYPGKDNVTLRTLGRLTSALTKLRKSKLLTTPTGGTPFVYLTEYGFFSSGKYRLSRKKQGSYLVTAFKMAQKNSRVKQMLQYLLAKPGGNLRHFDTSIVGRTGKSTTAFKLLAAWTKKAAKAGQIAVTGK